MAMDIPFEFECVVIVLIVLLTILYIRNEYRVTKNTCTQAAHVKTLDTSTQCHDTIHFQDKNSIPCGVCDSQLAALYCEQCKQHMCFACDWYHGRFLVTRYHSTVSCKSYNITREFTHRSNYVATLVQEGQLTLSGCNLDGWSYNHRHQSPLKCQYRSIFLGAARNTTDFYFVTRVFTSYPVLKGFIVLKIHEQEIMRLELTFDDLLNSRSFYIVSDIGMDAIWITAGTNTVYKLNSETKQLNVSFKTQRPSVCHGIAMFDGGLAISVRCETVYEQPEWHIQLITLWGKLQRQIIGKNEDFVFKKPENLASNAAQDILYISDGEANAVFAINPRGCVLFVYTSTNMFAPRGLSIDLEGHIYVACDQGVIQIHKHGNESRIVVRLKDNKPGIQTTFFDKKLNCLAVFQDMTTSSMFKFAEQLKHEEDEETEK